jgi:2-succinyl-5-enolpyruvyl-6-hydroxy-3-cyclohexene-1-carboxylate synthase
MSEMPEPGLLNLRWAQALTDGLAAAGLKELVLSPGSRSTPLALAFLRQPLIRCHVILDERSAAFFALGLAKASGRPAALLCTSGSAPANWFPAVIEADQSGTPLLLLSADRPPELQGWGANQTVDQNDLFGKHVRAFHAPGVPYEGFSTGWLHHLAARAISESRWPLPGPVHLNLPFREPLLPAEVTDWPTSTLPAEITVATPRLLPDSEIIADIARQIAGRPGVILCGGADYPADFADVVSKLAARLNCPVFAEPLSNLRLSTHALEHLCVRYDAFLRNPQFVAEQRPEWLLRFGAFPVTRTLQTWLTTTAAPQQIIVAPDGRWPDPQHTATTFLQADPSEVCRSLHDTALQPAAAAWPAAFWQAEATIRRITEIDLGKENFEGALIPALINRLPAGHRMFCGNSMAIRDLDAFSGSSAKPLTFYGNRGASGIDGNVSTAAGIACSGPTVVLLGDLSCTHDIGGLANLKGLDLVLLVINNGGGGIFEYLPQAALPEFERAWLTPAAIDFAHAAQAWGIPHQRVSSLAAFNTALDTALAAGGPRFIEVMIDRAQSVAQHRAYWQRVSTASLADSL